MKANKVRFNKEILLFLIFTVFCNCNNDLVHKNIQVERNFIKGTSFQFELRMNIEEAITISELYNRDFSISLPYKVNNAYAFFTIAGRVFPCSMKIKSDLSTFSFDRNYLTLIGSSFNENISLIVLEIKFRDEMSPFKYITLSYNDMSNSEQRSKFDFNVSAELSIPIGKDKRLVTEVKKSLLLIRFENEFHFLEYKLNEFLYRSDRKANDDLKIFLEEDEKVLDLDVKEIVRSLIIDKSKLIQEYKDDKLKFIFEFRNKQVEYYLSDIKNHKTTNQVISVDKVSNLHNLKSIKLSNSDSYSASYLNDNLIAYSNKDYSISIFDYTTEKVVKTLKGHSGSILALLYIKDGILISGSCDETIKIWDIETESVIRTLNGHSGCVLSLLNLENNLIASGGKDSTVKIWNILFGREIKTLQDHTGYVYSLGSFGNNKFISGSSDGKIVIWDTDKIKTQPLQIIENDLPIYSLVYLGDNKIGAGFLDGSITIYEINNETVKMLNFTGSNERCNSLVALGNGIVASGSDDNSIILWDVISKKEIKTYKNHESPVSIIIKVGKDKLASLSTDNQLIIWGFDEE